MSDVEKYGLWAVIGFAGILVLIGLGGGEDEQPLQQNTVRPLVVQGPVAGAEPAAKAAAAPTRRTQAARPEPAPASNARVLTVPPVVTTGESFRWEEGPVAYPGPRSARTPGAVTADGEAVTHTIAKGETLSDVSAKYYGTSTMWRELLALNPGLDPKRLKPGQVIVVRGPVRRAEAQVAALKSSTPTTAPSGRTYVVREGDTLGEIAARMLGSSRRSQELYELNKHVLSSPDRLKAGQVLVLP